MKKDLKQLFESDLLNDETKAVLNEAWDVAVQANKTELEAEYAEKLNESKKELHQSAMQMVEEAISEELQNVAEELADARSLEVQYAEKLKAFKESYAEKNKEMVDELVAETVKEEIGELKEDIEFAKKHQFGMKVFEAFQETFENNFGSADVDVHKQLEEAQKQLEDYKRTEIINGLLESVSGEKRDVVSTILEGVSTDKLESKFETLRPIILKETDENGEEVVTEGDEVERDQDGKIVLETTAEQDKQTKDNGIPDPVADRIARSLKRI